MYPEVVVFEWGFPGGNVGRSNNKGNMVYDNRKGLEVIQ